MAAVTSIIAGVAAAAAVGGLATSVIGQQQARRAAGESRRAQESAQSEQRAANAQAAAEDRRRQVREERVRRARIIQASVNTGTASSSGEAGALGALSTNLSGGLGASVGGEARAGRIGGFLQQSANAQAGIQRGQNTAALGNQIYGLGSTIFSAAGGFGTMFGSNTPNGFDTATGIPYRFQ